jgi:hypothetical protein
MTFKCFHCGFTVPAAENYKQHLLVVHPNTALAQSVKRQLVRSEKQQSANSPK